MTSQRADKGVQFSNARRHVEQPRGLTVADVPRGGSYRESLTRMRGVVARTGFEPVISTLKGWRPRPLDERATHRRPGVDQAFRFVGSAYGIRTRDLHLERVVS